MNILDDFSQQINDFFVNKNTLALIHLNRIRKNRIFDDTNSCFNVSLEEKRAILPDFQRYVSLDYMEYMGKKQNTYNTHLYRLTRKGADIINAFFEEALKTEKKKQGKTVTLKEYDDLSRKINARHDVLTGGTVIEFKQKDYPEMMRPLIEEAEKMLERPFNAHSLIYKGDLESDIKRIKKTIEKWNQYEIKENKIEILKKILPFDENYLGKFLVRKSGLIISYDTQFDSLEIRGNFNKVMKICDKIKELIEDQ